MKTAITVGSTLDFLTEVAGFPASDGWTLKYRLVPQSASGDAIEWSAATADDESSYRTQLGPSTTAEWQAGDYAWFAWVEKSGARYDVDSGLVTLRPDPAQAAAGTEFRSPARRTLAAIEAVIEGRASLDQQSYTIEGRTLERTPVRDLILLRDRYAAMVRAEEAAERLNKGLGSRNRLVVRF